MRVDGELVGAIGPGLLALIGVRPDDDPRSTARLVERVLSYRVFADDEGRMNRSLSDSGGALLAVPQFTLAADTRSGRRPSFSVAAAPDQAVRCFDEFVRLARTIHPHVACGRFGAEMYVSLVNHGPVTFWLES